MGVVLTSLLEGMDKIHPLLDATTLCGACVEVCPVRVPLVKLLTMLHEERVNKGLTPFTGRGHGNVRRRDKETVSVFRGAKDFKSFVASLKQDRRERPVE